MSLYAFDQELAVILWIKKLCAIMIMEIGLLESDNVNWIAGKILDYNPLEQGNPISTALIRNAAPDLIYVSGEGEGIIQGTL